MIGGDGAAGSCGGSGSLADGADTRAARGRVSARDVGGACTSGEGEGGGAGIGAATLRTDSTWGRASSSGSIQAGATATSSSAWTAITAAASNASARPRRPSVMLIDGLCVDDNRVP